MVIVGEPINDGDGGVLGEALNIAMSEGADHDEVDHGRNDAGAVFDRFAATELGVCAREK